MFPLLLPHLIRPSQLPWNHHHQKRIHPPHPFQWWRLRWRDGLDPGSQQGYFRVWNQQGDSSWTTSKKQRSRKARRRSPIKEGNNNTSTKEIGLHVPISTSERLGDVVTGEQAFAVLEAVNSLDVAFLNDRYSNNSLLIVCDWYDINVRDAFNFAMREGWSLPFGVQTSLKIE